MVCVTSVFTLLAIASICSAVDPTPIGIDPVPEGLSDCRRAEDWNPVAYIGWRLDLSCVKIMTEFHESTDFPGSNALEEKIATCIIRVLPSGNVVSNESHLYEQFYHTDDLEDGSHYMNITEDTPPTYVIRYKIDDYCWYQIVQLNKTNIPAPNCRKPPEVNEFRLLLGELHKLRCPAPKSLANVRVKYKWIYNCGEDMASNVKAGLGGSLTISDSSFANAGSYLCIIEYDGKEMAVFQHNTCISYRQSTNDPIPLHCPNVVSVRKGKDAVIKCDADVGVNKANTLLMGSTWFRERNSTAKLCVTEREGRVANSSAGSRIQCSMTSMLEDDYDACYTSQPETGPLHDWYSINLTIRNINDDDFGVYRLQFGEGVNLISDFNVTVQEDIDGLLTGHIAAIAVAAFIALLILLTIVVFVWKKHDVQWYWKKHFGPYETEIHTYMAYFAYYFDTEKMGDQSRKLTDSLVNSLYEFMDKFGGTVYDEQSTPNLHQYDADNILQAQGDCHRMILILSPEYITDQWNLHKTYTALTEVVNTGKKVVFITLPGIKKAISVLDDAPKKTLLFGMKKNITIHWSGKLPLSGSFRRRLEYALPKLPKPGYNRCFSGSSQAQLTHHNKHADKYISSITEHKNGFDSVIV